MEDISSTTPSLGNLSVMCHKMCEVLCCLHGVNGVTTHHAMLMSRILSSHAQPVEAFWSFFFSFSWGHFNSQEKQKTTLMQNLGVTNKEHYGMLWYFLEWSSGQLQSLGVILEF